MESSFISPEEIQEQVREQLPEFQWPDVEDENTWPQEERPTPLGYTEEDLDQPQDPFQGFSPEIRQDLEGLTHLGYLEDSFSFCGHHFVVKTLRGEEELAASLAIQEYRNTLKEPEAWVWANVALSLKSVDGDENFCPPIGPDVNDYARARLKYCTSKWFYPLAEYIWVEHCIPLQQRQLRALEALQGLSKRDRNPSSPKSDSSTGWAISENSPPSTQFS
jgi:hypothetical protein